jgi:hypothetical protein
VLMASDANVPKSRAYPMRWTGIDGNLYLYGQERCACGSNCKRTRVSLLLRALQYCSQLLLVHSRRPLSRRPSADLCAYPFHRRHYQRSKPLRHVEVGDELSQTAGQCRSLRWNYSAMSSQVLVCLFHFLISFSGTRVRLANGTVLKAIPQL